jgi:hypothetical protein
MFEIYLASNGMLDISLFNSDVPPINCQLGIIEALSRVFCTVISHLDAPFGQRANLWLYDEDTGRIQRISNKYPLERFGGGIVISK